MLASSRFRASGVFHASPKPPAARILAYHPPMGSPRQAHDRLTRMLREGRISRAEFDRQMRALGRTAAAPGSAPPSPPSPSSPRAPRPGWSGRTSMPSPQASAPLPTRIGSYQILGAIGRGGMGLVYRAIHRIPPKALEQGGEVALKVPHAEFARDPKFHSLFEREAYNGIALPRHPHIARVHDLVTEGHTLALVMELVQGRPLSAVIAKETGPLPPARALPLFIEALDALSTAHAARVVHRDIKPENIMVTPDWHVKILDFGVARSAATRNKTFAGRVGTLDYMAPEQYDRTGADRVGPRSDLYALGMSLYEALAGKLPWDAQTGEQIVIAEKLTGRIPPPGALPGVPPIPQPFIDVVMKAIALDPDHRFGSAGAFADALRAASRGVSPEPAPSPQPPPPRTAGPDVTRRATEVVREVPPQPLPRRRTAVLSGDEAGIDRPSSGPSPVLLAAGVFGLSVALIAFGFAVTGSDRGPGTAASEPSPAPVVETQSPAPEPPGEDVARQEPEAQAAKEAEVVRQAEEARREQQAAQREAARAAAEKAAARAVAEKAAARVAAEKAAAEKAAARIAAEEAAAAKRAREREEARARIAPAPAPSTRTSCSSGQDCQLRANVARRNGDLAGALALYKQACNLQSGAGCYGAAQMYEGGQVTGTPEPSKAKEWYGKGCQHDHAISCSKR